MSHVSQYRSHISRPVNMDAYCMTIVNDQYEVDDTTGWVVPGSVTQRYLHDNEWVSYQACDVLRPTLTINGLLAFHLPWLEEAFSAKLANDDADAWGVRGNIEAILDALVAKKMSEL